MPVEESQGIRQQMRAVSLAVGCWQAGESPAALQVLVSCPYGFGKRVAGAGVEPASPAYETSDLPLILPAFW